LRHKSGEIGVFFRIFWLILPDFLAIFPISAGYFLIFPLEYWELIHTLFGIAPAFHLFSNINGLRIRVHGEIPLFCVILRQNPLLFSSYG